MFRFFEYIWSSPKPSVTEYEFQMRHSFDSRKKESTKLLEKYTDKVPIVFERSDQCYLNNLTKDKMLIKKELTVGQLILILRTDLKLTSDQNLYLMINNDKVPSIHQTVESVYDAHKHKDGFLYITYTSNDKTQTES